MLIVPYGVQTHISSDSGTYQDYPPLTHLTHVFSLLTSKCETLYMKYCMINSPKRKEDLHESKY